MVVGHAAHCGEGPTALAAVVLAVAIQAAEVNVPAGAVVLAFVVLVFVA